MKALLRTLAAGLALVSLAAAPSSPVTEFFGEISDPVGDSLHHGWEPASKPAPDLVYASVQAADGQLQLTALFDPGTFGPDTGIAFSLDTDTDPSTGWPGTTSNLNFDADVLGVEYVIDTKGADFGGKARLWAGSRTAFTLITTDIDVTFGDDGLQIVIPLSLIGDDDGRMYFKAVTWVQRTAVFSWGISDWITDPNTQPGSTVPADEEIADLDEVIEDLETAGTLGQGPARSLSNHLENALRALEAGHDNAARAQLEAFIGQVLDWVDDGTLTAEEAEPLIGAAERLLAGL